MAAPHMTAKIQKALKEFIESVPSGKLEMFVKIPDTQPGDLATSYSFKSRDFHLAFLSEKDGEPAGCWYFEVRGSTTSEHSAIQQLAKKSSKYDQNQKVFAHVAFEENVMSWFHAEHIRHAIGLSPLWAAERINKVHVVRNPDPKLKFVDLGEDYEPPRYRILGMPDDMNRIDAFLYQTIPFPGFNVDGTKTKQPGKQAKKSAGEGSSKSGNGSKK